MVSEYTFSEEILEEMREVIKHLTHLHWSYNGAVAIGDDLVNFTAFVRYTYKELEIIQENVYIDFDPITINYEIKHIYYDPIDDSIFKVWNHHNPTFLLQPGDMIWFGRLLELINKNNLERIDN